MTPNHHRVLAGSLALLVPLAASAQEVRGRELSQQRRIGRGIHRGQITAGGAARLENREAALNADGGSSCDLQRSF